jgi:MFS transporter, YQGE family, putative transporter
MCKDAKILLTLSALFTFAIGLSSIFVNAFIWRQTSDFTVIAIYNLFHYISTPLTFILAGIIAKRKNPVWAIRIGLLLYASFYAFILFVGDRGVVYIYLLGFLYGMAAGFYWLAYNTLSFDLTSVNNRDTYNGIHGSCCGIAGAVAPIVSGYIITRFRGMTGYNIVFTMTLVIFGVLVFVSMILKCKNYGHSINFKKAFSRNCEEWAEVRKAISIWGFRDVTIVFLVNILIIQTTGSELSLGKFSFIASIITSLSFLLVQKIIKPPKRRMSIIIGITGLSLSIIGISMNISYRTLIIYTLMDAFFIPFFIIQLSSSTFNVINRAHDENLRVEYMINRDIVLNGGRIISTTILIILLKLFKDTFVLTSYLLFIGVAPLVSGYFLLKLKKLLAGTK